MLNLLVIRSAQPAQAAAFYGLFLPDFDYHRHGKGPMHYACELDGFVFEIYPLSAQQSQPDTFTRLGFGVTQLDDILTKIELAGYSILEPAKNSPWGYRAVVQDVDGRKVELVQVLPMHHKR